MSSNTTFSSQGNFNRPAITKLKPQKEIVNTIVLGSTFILLLISFIDSISHYFVGNIKHKAPSYFSIYIIVVSAIFIFSLINIINNFIKEKNSGLSRVLLAFNILYIVSTIAFIIILHETNHNMNYIKNSLWDFSGLSNTDRKQKLSLCISAYFGDSFTKPNSWLGISISSFIISILMLFNFKFGSIGLPARFGSLKGIPYSIIFTPAIFIAVVIISVSYSIWYKKIHEQKANTTCPTTEN